MWPNTQFPTECPALNPTRLPQNVSENIAVLKNTNDGSTGGRVLFHKTLRIFSEQLLCEMLPKLFAKRPWVKLHNI